MFLKYLFVPLNRLSLSGSGLIQALRPIFSRVGKVSIASFQAFRSWHCPATRKMSWAEGVTVSSGDCSATLSGGATNTNRMGANERVGGALVW